MRPDQRPTYHFLHIAPNLGAEWLFDAARRYWETFRPTVVPDFGLLLVLPEVLPNGAPVTVTVTVIALRDTLPGIGVELAQAVPTAYFDVIAFDTFEQAKAELDRRADSQQPFGVPIATPTLNMPVIPTVRLPATRPPNGFVTATPTPAPTRPASPTPPIVTTPGTPGPLPVDPNVPQPIPRTPGPITGGGG